MLFNPCKNYYFQPEMDIAGVRIEVVKEMKLLGVIITDDLELLSPQNRYIGHQCGM